MRNMTKLSDMPSPPPGPVVPTDNDNFDAWFGATKEGRVAVIHVLAERIAQDRKWGTQNHSPEKWATILMEEVGEFADACLNLSDNSAQTHKDIYKEAVQVAAVAVAFIEWMERGLPR